MPLLISDSNILIDLEEGKLIELLFLLSDEFMVPDLLFYDELETSHAHLLEKGLRLGELTPKYMAYASKLSEKYPKPSRYDCVALALAAQEKCPLLTGDQDLRNAAKQEQVEVMGTIWLVESMLKQKILTPTEAKQAYLLMKKSGRRLPWKDAFQRLQNLT